MGLGKNIQKLRIQAGLTQKDLAEKLFVTAQAVSRWEQDIVEPNIQTLRQMSEIFGVSLDEIISGKADEKTVEEVVETTPQKQVLCMCDTCHRPIYVGEEVKDTKHKTGAVVHECPECYEKRVAAEKAKVALDAKTKRKNGIKKRIIGIVVGCISMTLIAIIAIASGISTNNAAIVIPTGVVLAVMMGLFLFNMIVNNSFIPDVWFSVCDWGFVRMPGIIFELSLDGIIWLLTVKLLFWILGILLAIAAGILATILCMVLSIFVFPYALVKSIKNPELSID